MSTADKRIVVCGFGAITSVGELGANKETVWTSLKRGNSGFRPLTEHFADLVVESSVRNIKASTVAPVRDFDPARYLRADFLKDYRRLDPVILYALSAGTLAMDMSHLEVTEENSRAIRVKVGTGLGGGQSFETGVTHFQNRGRSRRLYNTVVNVMGNAAAGFASLYFGLKGSSSTAVAACASSAYAVTEACDKIKLGKAVAMLVIGSEASMTPFIIACFDSIGVDSGALSRKSGGSLPFAADRDGFVLGEGAGAVVLADAEWAARNGLIPLAEILGYWENAGAQHMVQPNSEETAYCMMQAIAQAKLTPQDIDYVNAHATATAIGDRAESQALHRVFRSTAMREHNKPYVNSTKALIGHTCGAAGVIELIVAILSLRDGVIHPMGDYDVDPVCLHPGGRTEATINIVSRNAVIDRLRFALTNSFGFGDENASIVVGCHEF
jgi:3-oxoacyl-[acyl-carrier-protein] synthase II